MEVPVYKYIILPLKGKKFLTKIKLTGFYAGERNEHLVDYDENIIGQNNFA